MADRVVMRRAGIEAELGWCVICDRKIIIRGLYFVIGRVISLASFARVRGAFAYAAVVREQNNHSHRALVQQRVTSPR